MSNASKQHIAIIDLGAGNLRSVHKAMERAAQDNGCESTIIVTKKATDIAKADRIVLPGVGAFKACMDGLNSLPCMRDALELCVLQNKKPLLGICVGMQLLAGEGREFGRTPGLGWIPGCVKKLDPEAHKQRIPHMGWNQVKAQQNHDLFGSRNELSDENFYFLHSYHFETEIDKDILGMCAYGNPIIAAVTRDNIIGVQFHPEKSQGAGIALLKNFLNWTPKEAIA